MFKRVTYVNGEVSVWYACLRYAWLVYAWLRNAWLVCESVPAEAGRVRRIFPLGGEKQ
jgi:hypothetical protein